VGEKQLSRRLFFSVGAVTAIAPQVRKNQALMPVGFSVILQHRQQNPPFLGPFTEKTFLRPPIE